MPECVWCTGGKGGSCPVIIILLIQKAVGPILNSLFPCERLSGVADPCARVRVNNVRLL